VSERWAVVTGVAGAIGGAVAELLRESGSRVYGIDRETPTVELDEFASVDLADADAALAAFEALAARDIDRLVNAAGVLAPSPAAGEVLEHWERTMAVNVRAPYLAMTALREELERTSGAVVNISSVHAVATSRGLAAYAASKGALTALTRVAALEFAPRVRVNAIAPGAVESAMLRAGLARDDRPEEARAELVARTPLGRIGDPHDIADAVAFLLDGARSSFITGQQLVVDGGATAILGTEA
jgi:NAD(P)-dependent dehydrogenase (short-subunit alcohol dehydrogenase family)